MHDRLFADNPPAKNYAGSFPSKVLRHLGAWTFYSAPTKGELALLDKSMYDLENKTENPDKNNAEEKKHPSHTENKTDQGTAQQYKHTPRTQSHKAGDDIKRLETRKEKTQKVNNVKQVQTKEEREKILQNGTNEGTGQEKPRLTPETTQRKPSGSASLEKTKQHEKKGKNTETSKMTKRRSNVKRAPTKLQKNAQAKSTNLQAPIAKVKITLKKSRGKVLGGAETGDEISTEPLTVEGHHVSVPGHVKSPGQSYRHTGEGTNDALKVDDHKETVKFNANKRKDSGVRKENRSSNCDKDTAELDSSRNENSTASEKAQLKNLKRSVIKIPSQVNDSSEEVDNNREVTPHVDDIMSRNKTDSGAESQEKGDSLKSEEHRENAVKPEASSESRNSNLENDALRNKHVTFSSPGCEKEPASEKKRAKSQNAHKKERKRSGKNRVKSG